jgi:putative N6-adenine-specific DNA methylase
MTTISTSQFNLTIIPGLEDIAIEEFNYLWPKIVNTKLPEIERKKGKLYFECEISQICKLVPYLRVPTQVLMQIEQFSCKDSPKLFNKISKIDWSKYLRGSLPIITASAKESKLINTSLIKDRATKAIEQSSKHNPIKSAPKDCPELKNKVHIDIYKDNLKIELSLIGERLDRRGFKTKTDQAPIRESIAAAMIFKLSQYENSILRDPMAGTGTFSTEALLRNEYNSYRSFDFQHAPYFINLPLTKRAKIEDKKISTFFINDYESKAVNSIKENIKLIKKKNNIEVEVNDFFKIADLDEEYSIIINPPYGKRIKLEEPLNELVTKILLKCKELKNAKHLAIIFPKWATETLKNEEILYKSYISNGGIDVVLVILRLN